MKVLFVINSAGGLFIFRERLMSEFCMLGSLSAIVPQSDDEAEQKAREQLNDIGCKCICVPMERRGINPASDIKLYKNIKTILKQEKTDLVITYTIKPNIYGGIACRLARVTYAVNITGLGTAFEGNGIVKKIVCALYRIALKKAKVVFFENSENRDILVRLGLVKQEKTKVLAGAGVDLEKFSAADYPANDGETKFLFIGRVMREKGIDELVSAMRHLREDGVNCSLDVVGPFEEDYSETIKKAEGEGWLRYHGVQNDVRPFIADCHCFVLPSWHEGMANTNLECAASGRPLITSNIAGCREAVIENQSGLLCEPKNAESLYEKMKQFCAMPTEQRIQFGLRGRKHMEEVFDKRKVVAETIKALGL